MRVFKRPFSTIFTNFGLSSFFSMVNPLNEKTNVYLISDLEHVSLQHSIVYVHIKPSKIAFLIGIMWSINCDSAKKSGKYCTKPNQNNTKEMPNFHILCRTNSK